MNRNTKNVNALHAIRIYTSGYGRVVHGTLALPELPSVPSFNMFLKVFSILNFSIVVFAGECQTAGEFPQTRMLVYATIFRSPPVGLRLKPYLYCQGWRYLRFYRSRQ